MKKLLLFILIFSFGCNQPNSTSNKSDDNNSENNTFPTNEYFQISSISKAHYIEESKFELEFDISNNSNYKFSVFSLNADIYYKMKNSEDICRSTVQWDDMKPVQCVVRDWEPHTTKHFYFTSPCGGCPGGCGGADYNRTPENIVLEIKIDNATSVDEEVKGVLARYDLLDLWKEKQMEEGLR